MFFRADKIDLKSLDVQLENQLNKAWKKGKGISGGDRPKEEWEIDLSKLEIRYEVARGTYGTVYRGTYDGQDVAAVALAICRSDPVLNDDRSGDSSKDDVIEGVQTFIEKVVTQHKDREDDYSND